MNIWTKTTREVDYHKNEWCVMYIDECGDNQIMLFDIFEQAQKWFNNLDCCRVGIVTTNFYNNVICKDIKDK